jgi:hypothetical protein
LTFTRISGCCQGGGGDVAVGGDAEVDVLGSAGGGQVGLGELVVGGGEADLESLGFADPAFALGFGDASQEVVADLFEAVPLGGVDSEEGASDDPLTELTEGASGLRLRSTDSDAVAGPGSF